MKVASTQPKVVKSPVRITDTKYSMWYAKPINLGEIEKRGDYWYTADNHRFMSSRDALDYLIAIHEAKQGNAVPPARHTPSEKIAEKRTQRKQVVAEITVAPTPMPRRRATDDAFIGELIEYLAEQPSAKGLLDAARKRVFERQITTGEANVAVTGKTTRVDSSQDPQRGN